MLGKKRTHQQFIEKAITIHGEKYCYPENYINSRTKINIECLIHGNFLQKPSSHLDGDGCPKCGNFDKGNHARFSQDQFIELAKKAHGDKYDYINSKYVN